MKGRGEKRVREGQQWRVTPHHSIWRRPGRRCVNRVYALPRTVAWLDCCQQSSVQALWNAWKPEENPGQSNLVPVLLNRRRASTCGYKRNVDIYDVSSNAEPIARPAEALSTSFKSRMLKRVH